MDFTLEFEPEVVVTELSQLLVQAEQFGAGHSKVAFERWHDHVKDFLSENFTSNEISEFFVGEVALRGAGVYFSGMSAEDKIGSYDLPKARKALRRIKRELEKPSLPEKLPVAAKRLASGNVFIVHGHNEAVLLEVKHLIEKQGLDAIVLRDVPSGGATVIEKFEKSADVGFAVVIMSADDVGGKATDPSSIKPRCRQNVLLELGYFIGKLGRDRVCSLKDEGIELPSDILGVIYTPIDEAGFWKYKLADELTHAGYEIDKNKI